MDVKFSIVTPAIMLCSVFCTKDLWILDGHDNEKLKTAFPKWCVGSMKQRFEQVKNYSKMPAWWSDTHGFIHFLTLIINTGNFIQRELQSILLIFKKKKAEITQSMNVFELLPFDMIKRQLVAQNVSLWCDACRAHISSNFCHHARDPQRLHLYKEFDE